LTDLVIFCKLFRFFGASETGLWEKFVKLNEAFKFESNPAERLTRVPRVREVWSSNPGLAKPYTALQTARRSFNIYAGSCAALAL